MIERKPSRSKTISTDALVTGAELYSAFRKDVPLEGPLTASAVAAVSLATGLSERQVRRLAVRFLAKPVAASLAPRPRGPKVGSHRISEQVKLAIECLTAEIFLTKPAPTVALAAREIHGLLVSEDGNFRFSFADVPSERTLIPLIGEISEPHRARASMGSKHRSAHEPHPGAYHSDGLLDLIQMDHTRADVILVDSVHREDLARPWLTLRPWPPGEASQRLILELARGMRLIEPERFAEPELAEFLWRHSHGVTGNFKRLLHWSLKVARRGGRERIDIADLHAAAQLLPAYIPG